MRVRLPEAVPEGEGADGNGVAARTLAESNCTLKRSRKRAVSLPVDDGVSMGVEDDDELEQEEEEELDDGVGL